jgi:hypothetical protein
MKTMIMTHTLSSTLEVARWTRSVLFKRGYSRCTLLLIGGAGVHSACPSHQLARQRACQSVVAGPGRMPYQDTSGSQGITPPWLRISNSCDSLTHTHTKSFLQSPLWLEDHCRLPEGAHLRNVTIGDRGRSFALIAVLAPGVPLSEPQPRERRPISHSSLLAEGCAIRMGVPAQRFIYLLADGYRAKTRAPIPQRNPYPMANVRLYGQNSS